MAKIKNFQIIQVPVEVEYINPILGRLMAVYAWVRCIKLIKYRINYPILGSPNKTAKKDNYYMLAIPKFEVVNHGTT